MRVLSVVGFKGGSGKTTVAVNVADVLGERMPVVLIDTDLQASAAAWFGGAAHVRVEHITDVDQLGQVLRQRWDGVAVVDGRPGDPYLTRVLVDWSDLLLVPLRPSPLDLHGNAPVLERIGAGQVNGLAVFTMAVPRTQDAEIMRRTLADQYNVRAVQTVLHHRIAYARAPLWDCGVCDADQGGPAAAEVLALADEVAKALGV